MKAAAIFIVLIMLSGCSNYAQEIPIASCIFTEAINPGYSKAEELQEVISELVNKGVPGTAVAVYSNEGWWAAAAGLAKIETRIPMELCQLQYLQSVAKTYMAVAILKLYEEGKIDLQASIVQYLPEKFLKYLPDVTTVTINMLLNHTSGLPEYNYQPNYVSKLLSHPNYFFRSEEYLQFIEGKPLNFAPGSKYSYRNTNYLLLALIADAITGDHAAYIAEKIFEPLGLTNTFYRNDTGYLNYPNLVNSYWDRYSDGIIENVSRMQQTNVASLVGDDGIVATPVDAVKFLKGLVEGSILAPATLELMKTWVNDKEGKPTYGLGLDYATFDSKPAYGHSGGGLGAGCYLYYFPEQDIYVFMGINLGTVTEGPILTNAEDTVDKFFEVLLRE
ncbi:MAG: beta-lactamase family protein [Cyclobacteriaceae bacterium]|nr:beta-lactamase family protein [Cyclobacteriaceae bacterium]